VLLDPVDYRFDRFQIAFILSYPQFGFTARKAVVNRNPDMASLNPIDCGFLKEQLAVFNPFFFRNVRPQNNLAKSVGQIDVTVYVFVVKLIIPGGTVRISSGIATTFYAINSLLDLFLAGA